MSKGTFTKSGKYEVEMTGVGSNKPKKRIVNIYSKDEHDQLVNSSLVDKVVRIGDLDAAAKNSKPKADSEKQNSPQATKDTKHPEPEKKAEFSKGIDPSKIAKPQVKSLMEKPWFIVKMENGKANIIIDKKVYAFDSREEANTTKDNLEKSGKSGLRVVPSKAPDVVKAKQELKPDSPQGIKADKLNDDKLVSNVSVDKIKSTFEKFGQGVVVVIKKGDKFLGVFPSVHKGHTGDRSLIFRFKDSLDLIQSDIDKMFPAAQDYEVIKISNNDANNKEGKKINDVLPKDTKQAATQSGEVEKETGESTSNVPVNFTYTKKENPEKVLNVNSSAKKVSKSPNSDIAYIAELEDGSKLGFIVKGGDITKVSYKPKSKEMTDNVSLTDTTKKALLGSIKKKDIKETTEAIMEIVVSKIKEYEEQGREPLIAKLVQELKNHDWGWESNDEMSDYARQIAGERQSKIDDLVNKLGEEGKKYYNHYAPDEMQLKEENPKIQEVKAMMKMKSEDLADYSLKNLDLWEGESYKKKAAEAILKKHLDKGDTSDKVKEAYLKVKQTKK